jgi:hypothetical protein
LFQINAVNDCGTSVDLNQNAEKETPVEESVAGQTYFGVFFSVSGNNLE